ncbi:unnamed protein product [Pleuronectes platessa]|uniref:Uncharacterized protein n=1 Tax=Pleuronectes platessa TaxID=8262 RepID=A0A9N7TLM8_PLEPL|nr:unnamed protein product [Pleuronectes platessa]
MSQFSNWKPLSSTVLAGHERTIPGGDGGRRSEPSRLRRDKAAPARITSDCTIFIIIIIIFTSTTTTVTSAAAVCRFPAVLRGDVGLTRDQPMQEDGDREEDEWVRLPGKKQHQVRQRMEETEGGERKGEDSKTRCTVHMADVQPDLWPVHPTVFRSEYLEVETTHSSILVSFVKAYYFVIWSIRTGSRPQPVPALGHLPAARPAYCTYTGD